MKKILGLDLGTNSVGWALVEQDFENKQGQILGMGSRIIPMDEKVLGEFGKGNSVSQTAKRTEFRSTRRLYERNHLRRERLHRALNVLGFLPEHYANDIDFEKRFGKFKDETETKLVWKKNEKKENGKDKFEFVFQSAFKEMLDEFRRIQPDLLNRKNKKGEDVKIPYDWTIYYLRKKAITEAITKEELAWLILNFNQKRGYYQLRGEEEDSNTNINEYVIPLTITKVEKGEVDKKNDKKTWYTFTLSNSWFYSATFTVEPKWLNIEKDFLVTEELDENGSVKIVKDKKSDTIGKEKRRITPLPSFDEINLMSKKDQDKIYKKIKARTEVTIENSKQTVGTYIYESLLKNPTQKIRGKLVRTIERKFYKDELKAILEKQIALQPQLFADDLYNACVRELYRSNEAHQLQLSKRDFVHLFLDDIIFYQRPLRSQKSSIGNCSLEFRLHKINKKDNQGNSIKNVFEKDKDGNDIEVKEYLKCIPKSNPYYQEFRVWQWLYNLKIYTKKEDEDVTDQFIKSDEDKEKLFDFLISKKEVDHKDILKYFFKDLKSKAQTTEITKYRWNYVYDSEKDESKIYPMNKTGYEIRKRLEKVKNVPPNFLTREIEQQFWHIIYSVTDKKEYEMALERLAKKHNLYSFPKENRKVENTDKACFVENFKNLAWIEKDYGSFSEKAIKKLLPLLRIGKYWNWENIDLKTQERIDKLLTGEFDPEIQNRVREKAINLTDKNHFQGLQLWLASYVVYDRHSEATNISKWNSVEDLKNYLNEFKQHSLRNPIVEQVITETLRVVKDIWQYYGKGTKDFFDEIHIELGREMKNTAEDRAKITKQVSENENTNLRIKAMLLEFATDNDFKNQIDYSSYCKDESNLTFYQRDNNPIRPHSPTQHDILKIFEEYVLNDYAEETLKNEKTGLTETKDGKTKEISIYDISQKSLPTKSQIEKYKLWLEQKYRSPYTGQMISLTKLFTPEYEIEHIIPKSRYFDDSLSNKVICEEAVNKKKDNQLGLEFIKNHHGEKIQIGEKHITIFTEEAYKKFVDEHYSKNKAKRNKLLLEDIPDKMIARQLNDTRYISKFVSQLLSNIVREGKDDDGINSKNIIPGNGKITDRLKQDWGLNDAWNELTLPRFERMNELLQKTTFTAKNKKGHTISAIPLELSKGFSKKRIDHRHHAMDALVIACATRNHVNLLNNQSAKSDNSRFDLQNKLRNKEKWKDNNGKEHDKFTEFNKPWKNFTVDAKNELEKIVVSFKQNLRVINKATNHYEKIVNGKKVEVEQKGVNWAIRKPLHKETVSGKVYLLNEAKEMTIKKALEKVNELKDIQIIVDKNQRKIINKHFSNHRVDIENALKDENLKGLKKINVFEPQSATRKPLDTTFTEKIIKESVTDTGIQKILLNHLSAKVNNPELAFSPEGIEDMNKNIISLNGNKFHQPIFKVRIYETIGSKFSVGQKGNKKDKYVEAAKGTNLFFAIYQDENKKRDYATIPLNKVIEMQKQGLSPVPETDEKGNRLLFYLSPNDIVYVPTANELANNYKIDFENLTSEQRKRIYKFTDGSGKMANFIPTNIATVLFNMNKDKQKKAFGKEIFAIQNEIGVGSQGSKNENAITGEQIKSVCIKLIVDRLGNISKW